MKDQVPPIKITTETKECNDQMVNRASLRHVFFLYIAGLTPRSTMAIERIRAICDRYLADRYELTVIDLYLQPAEARRAQIVVAPTLVKKAPTPVRLFVGDMADEKKILLGLNLVAGTVPHN